MLYNYLVMDRLVHKNGDRQLDSIFAALADPTRRAILQRLANGEASVSELTEPFSISQPAISKHLKVLQRAGLVERDIDKQRRPARLRARPMTKAADWLSAFEAFWGTSFNQLDGVLANMKHHTDHGKD